MKPQGMVDIETLSSQPDGAIIAIGLCVFDDDTIMESTEILINPRFAPGHRDPDTLEWWNSQPETVFRRMMSGRVMPWDACESFTEFFSITNPKTIWANPPTFDVMMLRRLFKIYDWEFPFHYTGERDFRTIRKIADSFSIDYDEPYKHRIAHDAREDAICQAKALQIMLRDLALVS